jgi:hypothetical protein
MNAINTRIFDMLQRLHRFILEHSVDPAFARAAAAHAEVVNTITAFAAAAQQQTAGRGEAAGGVDLRENIWRELRRFLSEVNRTARVLEEDHPGIRAQFRLPRTRSYPALIAATQAIIAAATPIQESFIESGLPATFLADLAALLAAFRDATSQKHGGRIAQVAATAAMKAQARAGVIAATKLDAYMRNAYRGNTEMLAAWKHARHIERSPRRKRLPAAPLIPAGEMMPASQPADQNALIATSKENPARALPASDPRHPSSTKERPPLTPPR